MSGVLPTNSTPTIRCGFASAEISETGHVELGAPQTGENSGEQELGTMAASDETGRGAVDIVKLAKTRAKHLRAEVAMAAELAARGF
jgi:hypothetical protein